MKIRRAGGWSRSVFSLSHSLLVSVLPPFFDGNSVSAVLWLALFLIGSKRETSTQTRNLFFFTFAVSEKMFALPSYTANTPILVRNCLQTGTQWRLNTALLSLLCHTHTSSTRSPSRHPLNFRFPPSAVCFFFSCDILFTWVCSRQHRQ